MAIDELSRDEIVLEVLGKRLAQKRVSQSLTQVELAENAGIGKRTLERIENGASVQFISIIRVLRELKLLSLLDKLVPEVGISPMDQLKLKGKVRKRASKPYGRKNSDSNWEWGE